MNRHLWTDGWITARAAVSWPCPRCTGGELEFVDDSITCKHTIDSLRRSHQEDYCPVDAVYVFTAWLKCKAPNCRQEVGLVGTGTEEEHESWDEEGNAERSWRTTLKPLYCWPMPDIFKLPESAPTEVKTELRAAFRLFLSDQAAAAGRVRVSLERLLDHYRIPKRLKGGDGNFYDLNLHKRIEKFSEKESSVGEKLIALKWLGNTASHQGDVSRDDLLDGFEILEYLLAQLFEKERAVHVAKLARRLTRKHKRHPARKRTVKK